MGNLENEKIKIDEYDVATFIAKKKFEEKHPKEKQPEWLEKYIAITGEKVGKEKWIIRRIMFYKIKLESNQHWEIGPKGYPMIIETDPTTGKRYVLLRGGSSKGTKVLFEVEIDLSNGTAIVLADTDLNLLNESDYQLQTI